MKFRLIILYATAVLAVAIIAFMTYQVITTYRAHETFGGYCKWRGLVVVNKSADYGYCIDSHSGKTYKMDLVNGRWYLDGDLPNNWPF